MGGLPDPLDGLVDGEQRARARPQVAARRRLGDAVVGRGALGRRLLPAPPAPWTRVCPIGRSGPARRSPGRPGSRAGPGSRPRGRSRPGLDRRRGGPDGTSGAGRRRRGEDPHGPAGLPRGGRVRGRRGSARARRRSTARRSGVGAGPGAPRHRAARPRRARGAARACGGPPTSRSSWSPRVPRRSTSWSASASGADDYVTKPFSPREVVARVRTVLRRAAAPRPRPTGRTTSEPTVHEFAGLVHRRGPARGASSGGGRSELSALEFDLLVALATRRVGSTPVPSCSRRCGATTSTETSGSSTCTSGTCASCSVTTPAAPRIIGTVRGVGYKFLLT